MTKYCYDDCLALLFGVVSRSVDISKTICVCFMPSTGNYIKAGSEIIFAQSCDLRAKYAASVLSLFSETAVVGAAALCF